MTAADELRAAAEQIRDLAGRLELHSIRGPWSVHAGPRGYPQSVNNVGVPIHICDTFTDPKHSPTTAHWIAMMHPGVRVALAEVLTAWARMGDLDPDLLNRVGGPETVTLARLINAKEA